jgi:hypothetical protein
MARGKNIQTAEQTETKRATGAILFGIGTTRRKYEWKEIHGTQ